MPKQKPLFTKGQREEVIDIFVETFHEILIPVLETLATKKDIARLDTRIDHVETQLNDVKTDLEQVKSRVVSIDTKVDQVTDFHAFKLEEHSKRLEKLEAKTPLH